MNFEIMGKTGLVIAASGVFILLIGFLLMGIAIIHEIIMN